MFFVDVFLLTCCRVRLVVWAARPIHGTNLSRVQARTRWDACNRRERQISVRANPKSRLEIFFCHFDYFGYVILDTKTRFFHFFTFFSFCCSFNSQDKRFQWTLKKGKNKMSWKVLFNYLLRWTYFVNKVSKSSNKMSPLYDYKYEVLVKYIDRIWK